MSKNRDVLKRLSKSKEESYPDLKKMKADRDFKILKEKKMENKKMKEMQKQELKKKMAEKKKMEDQIDQFNNRSEEEELSDSDDGFL